MTQRVLNRDGRNAYRHERLVAIAAGTWERTRERGADPSLIPTPVDIAWAAGFLEGEGNFRTPTPGSPSANAHATQKDPESLRRLLALFGGSIGPHGQRDIWRWNVYGRNAIVCLEAIYPYMTERRRTQIDAVLLGCTRRHQ